MTAIAVETVMSGTSTASATFADAPEPLKVFVSIPPQRFLVQRIGGNRVDVSVLLPPGQSPHTYEPSTKKMVEISQAHAYFRVGVPFEKNVVDKIERMLKQLNVIDTRKDLDLIAITEPCDHDHGDHEYHQPSDHQHDANTQEPDPHIWMNPRLVKQQAQTIYQELCRLDPADKQVFTENLSAWEEELDAVDRRIAKALAPFKGREFFVYHPAYGYFAQAYGLTQTAVEASGKEPTAKQLTQLIARARASGIKLIFVQPQFSKRSAERLAKEIGGAVIPLDPLAEDYLNNLLKIASAIEQAFSGTSSIDDGQ